MNKRYSRVSIIALLVCRLLGDAPSVLAQVGLYDVFERRVVNSKTYSNPFDFNVIELQASFTSPSKRRVSFFGFYDGDGNGGQNGNVWKLRFMPDEVGTWNYTYTWTDGTPGESGIFTVIDTGLPGPLKIATDNPWYFMTARGEPFHWRGYSIDAPALYSPSGPGGSLLADVGWFKNVIQTKLIDRGYNASMWTGPVRRTAPDPAGFVWKESWWLDTNGGRHSVLSRLWKRFSKNSSTEAKRFRIPVWHAWESALRLSKDNKIYVFTFAAMVYSNEQRPDLGFTEFKPFLRYWVARFAPFYNFFGWSPTWEWMEIWSPDEVDQIMRYVHEIDPWKRLLSIHDCSHSRFAGWLGFSMRQVGSRTLFMGNSRTAGAQQGTCDGAGGIGTPFLSKPILGSEDVWESANADKWPDWTVPRNRTEVRRGIWGVQMAGVMPVYSEWANSGPPPPGGKGEGEPDVRRMFDFFYSKTRYRQYRQLNHLVSASPGQIASGIPGHEYLVYDQYGGAITMNLGGAAPSATFSVLWYDPKTGAEESGKPINGGATRTLTSPFFGDTVLLLRRESTKIMADRRRRFVSPQ